MRVERWALGEPEETAARARALTAAGADVRERGDAAVAEYEARFGGGPAEGEVTDAVRAGLRVASAYLEDTGRQAEIVEVKGSVELAPLTGLVEAIVDLTATGTTLRENRLAVREEIAVATARLIANPVAHKLKAAGLDRLVEAARERGRATAA